jgi:hypothetical protein
VLFNWATRKAWLAFRFVLPGVRLVVAFRFFLTAMVDCLMSALPFEYSSVSTHRFVRLFGAKSLHSQILIDKNN